MLPTKKSFKKKYALIGYATLSNVSNIPITTTPSPIPLTSHEDIFGSVYHSPSVDNSRIIFKTKGFYNINYSMEVSRVNGTSQDAAFWIRLNGTTAIQNSTSRIHIPINNTNSVITVPFTRYFDKNDYVEVMCHCLSNNDYMLTNVSGSGSGSLEIPNTPSVLIVVEGFNE